MKPILFCVLGLLLGSQAGAADYLVLEGSLSVHPMGSVAEDSCQRSYGFPDRLRMDDLNACGKGVSIEAVDDTLVCPVNDLASRGCFSLPAGQPMEIDDLQNLEPEVLHQWAELLVASSRSTTSGAKRLADTEKLEGFPVGTILKPGDELVITLPASDHARYSEFVLYQDESPTPVVRAATIEGQIRIPGHYLQYRSKYRWTVKEGGKTYTGSFDVAYEEDQQNFEAELEAITGYQTFPLETRRLVRAAKAREWQFTFDMVQAAQQIQQGGQGNE